MKFKIKISIVTISCIYVENGSILGIEWIFIGLIIFGYYILKISTTCSPNTHLYFIFDLEWN